MGEYTLSDKTVKLAYIGSGVPKRADMVSVVRCRDCTLYDGEGYGCSYGRGDDADGFCAWGVRKENFVTCKCGEDIEAVGEIQTCPRCGRKVVVE